MSLLRCRAVGAIAWARKLGWLLLLACSVCKSAQPPAAEIAGERWLIRGAVVYDGTGSAGVVADVRVADGRIVAVGDELQPLSGEQVWAAQGLALAPGFIDPHSHHRDRFDEQPAPASVLAQGITTVVAGVDGKANRPVAEMFSQLEAKPAAVNVAAFGPHNFYRQQVMKQDFRRPASKAEIEAMRELLAADMRAGALGLSTGLEYDPGIYSTKDELIALAKQAALSGGRYSSHLRSEDVALDAAVTELLEIARETRIPAHISHVKLAMSDLWGQADKLLARLDAARAQGLDITGDIYPYDGWQAPLQVLFPKRNFADLAAVREVLASVAPAELIRISAYPAEPAFVGRTLADIASKQRVDPAELLSQLLQRSSSEGVELWGIVRNMSEDDIDVLLRWPYMSICSDGKTDDAHPRGQGAFPRVLARFVRERRILPLAEAVRRMTGLTASTLPLQDRGRIAAQLWADLVLFDPARIQDLATFDQPVKYAQGVVAVWVNGQLAWKQGVATGQLPGRVLRRVVAH